MTEEAKRLVKALRNSYGYSERRDHEAADMIEGLSADLERVTEDDNFQRKLNGDLYAQMDQIATSCDEWKRRAEAAEMDLRSIIRQADDGCRLCAHHQPCRGKDCPNYISDKEDPRLTWPCDVFDFGICPPLENSPCNGCVFNNHWEWRGPCEENGGQWMK